MRNRIPSGHCLLAFGKRDFRARNLYRKRNEIPVTSQPEIIDFAGKFQIRDRIAQHQSRLR